LVIEPRDAFAYTARGGSAMIRYSIAREASFGFGLRTSRLNCPLLWPGRFSMSRGLVGGVGGGPQGTDHLRGLEVGRCSLLVPPWILVPIGKIWLWRSGLFRPCGCFGTFLFGPHLSVRQPLTCNLQSDCNPNVSACQSGGPGQNNLQITQAADKHSSISTN